MKSSLRVSCLIGCLCVFLSPQFVRAESWLPFSLLIDECDYIAQHQFLLRDGKVIGRRVVKTYWKAEDKKTPSVENISWSLKDFDPETDSVQTSFEFYGRGQNLWTASPPNNVILYPGTTAFLTTGEEIACSVVEFDSILNDVGTLKKKGSKIKGVLELSVFGKKQKCP